MKKILFPIAGLIFIMIASCSSDDSEQIIINNITNPEFYNFQRSNESTVDFQGQTARIQMAGETANAFIDFDNASQSSISAMFNHQAGENNFNDASLNASDKNLKSKVAASFDLFNSNSSESTQIKATFEDYITLQTTVVFPNRTTLASPGVAGQIADGTRTRYVNGKGLEYNQAFAKSLLGALMTDQMLNNYLSPSVLDEGENRSNNDNNITEAGKSYTTMEHKWDEAYGYLYGSSANATNPNLTIGEDDAFLNEYVGRVNDNTDFSTIAEDIWNAFKLGRAAIVGKNYQIRDAQAAIIKEKISTVIAARGIFYLQIGKNRIAEGNPEAAFHALSEAYGFVYSLRFTRLSNESTSLFSKSEVDSLLDMLTNSTENGFWDITPETLDAVSEAIASKFNFTVAQAATN